MENTASQTESFPEGKMPLRMDFETQGLMIARKIKYPKKGDIFSIARSFLKNPNINPYYKELIVSSFFEFHKEYGVFEKAEITHMPLYRKNELSRYFRAQLLLTLSKRVSSALLRQM